MGDRANVFIKTGDTGVYLYTHWDGTPLPEILQQALKRKLRWTDDAYLARIIFCQMVKEDVEGETGYGISVYTPDGADRVLEVDPFMSTVTVRGDRSWTFEEYCALSAEELQQVWPGYDED